MHCEESKEKTVENWAKKRPDPILFSRILFGGRLHQDPLKTDRASQDPRGKRTFGGDDKCNLRRKKKKRVDKILERLGK